MFIIKQEELPPIGRFCSNSCAFCENLPLPTEMDKPPSLTWV